MGGLPELSNCYCHPGQAGGLPVWANERRKFLSFEQQKPCAEKACYKEKDLGPEMAAGGGRHCS